MLQENVNPGKVFAKGTALVLHSMEIIVEQGCWLTDKIRVARADEMITFPCSRTVASCAVPRFTVGENCNYQDLLTKVIGGLVVVPAIEKNLKVANMKVGV